MPSGLIDGLVSSAAAKAVHAQRLDLPDVPHCDLALQTEAGYAFFRIIRPREDVLDRWRETQDEIANYLYKLSLGIGHLPNAYLTLLMQEPGDPITLQQIERNAYVCRKLVLPYSENAEALTQRLPFFGLSDQLQKAIRRPLADPCQAAAGTGLTPKFVDALLSPANVARLAADLTKYWTSDDIVTPVAERPTTSEVAAPLHRLRVRELTLDGFRNFGKTPPLRFHGDLIVIFGRNGTGKTSLVEALEWGLTGLSSRVELDSGRVPITAEALINRTQEINKAQVTITLEGSDQERLIVERTIQKGVRGQPVRVNAAGTQDRRLLTRLVHQPGPDFALSGPELRRTFQTLHFLSQHTLEALLSTESNHAAAITRMAGTERFVPLVKKAERVRYELVRILMMQRGLLDSTDSQLTVIHRQQTQHRNRLMEQRRRYAIVTLKELLHSIADRALVNGWSAESLKDAEAPRTALRGVLQALLTSAIPSHRETLLETQRRLQVLMDHLPELEEHYRKRVSLQADLDSALQARTEADVRSQKLTETLAQVRKDLSSLESQVEQYVLRQKQRTQLQSLQARHDSLTRALQKAKAERDGAEERKHRLEGQLNQVRSDLTEAEGHLSRNRSVLSHADRKHQEWRGIIQQLPTWKAALAEVATVEENLKALADHLREATVQESDAIRRLSGQAEAVSRLRSEVRALEQSEQERQKLLAALQKHLHEGEEHCPFCSHRWEGGHESLLKGVQAAANLLPTSLRLAQENLGAAQKVLDQLQAEVDAARARVQALTDQRRILTERRGYLAEQVSAWESALMTLPKVTFTTATVEDLEAQLAESEQGTLATRQHIARIEKGASQIREQYASLAESVRQESARALTAGQDVRETEAALEAVESEQRRLFADTDDDAVAPPPSDADRRMNKLREEARGLEVSIRDANTDYQNAQRRMDHLAQTISNVQGKINQYEGNLTALGLTDAKRTAIQVRYEEQVALLQPLDSLSTDVQQALAELEAEEILEQEQEADRQLQQLQDDKKRRANEIATLEENMRRLDSLLKRARELRQEQEQEHVEMFQPLINVLYQRLSPHPFFGDTVKVDVEKDNVLIQFQPNPNSNDLAPVMGYFSQAQRVSVSLSIFLSSALLQGWTRLGTICIDDPVQHLDDMNVFAFLDLVQGIVLEGRQLIITTASEDLYKTFLARFSGWNRDGQERFQAFRMEGVTPSGPLIIEDTGSDEEPMQ